MASKVIESERTVKEIEQPSRWERPALAGGIGYVAVFFVGMVCFILFVASKFAPMDAPPEEHAAAYREMGSLGDVTFYLLTLQAPFLLLFLGGLYAVLRRAEGGSGALAVSAFGAGIAMSMIWPIGLVIAGGVATGIAEAGGDAITAFNLDGMAPLSLALSAFPRTVLLGAASLVLLGSGIAPRWIGWTGLALGALSFISTGMLVSGAMFPLLMLGTLLFVVWILALCVALLRRSKGYAAK
ncbi:MAG: hypothetical protein CYG60_16495 [Actinobacteria bacterium]|jgi:hypothetical protein|nr:hypothetical protein [Actinomycetota bacterium]PLS84700.1 MAG: hypothetical protein CYG60_16495 [Actinomycetota bacterium]